MSERSMQVDENVFARVLREQSNLDELNHQVFEMLCSEMPAPQLAGVIYLSADPAVCMTRIGVRSRAGEVHLTESFVRACHDHHERWVRQEESRGTKICRIDVNANANYTESSTWDPGAQWVKVARDFICGFLRQSYCNACSIN